jgi:cysteine desulfurase
MTKPTYLDCAATTAVDRRVAGEVLRLMVEEFGNAGSRTHEYGLSAHREVGRARERIAKCLAAAEDEVVFTSGATESDNLALLGLRAHGKRQGRRHVVSTAIEHKAVLEPLARMEAEGFEVTLIRPDRRGHISAEQLLSSVRRDTLLVSVMHANNETGAVQPIEAIADGLRDVEAYFHVDAAQTFGKLNASLRSTRIDLISISGHKVFAPKGVGALIARRRGNHRIPLEPLMFGGGQERGLRPGTLPVPLVAGLGLAAELAETDLALRRRACESIRTDAIRAFLGLGAKVHGDPERGVLPNILSVSLPELDSEAAMVALREHAAISNGSACTSASYEPSHVLRAMGLDDDDIAGTIRLSWSHETPSVDWDGLVRRLKELIF